MATSLSKDAPTVWVCVDCGRMWNVMGWVDFVIGDIGLYPCCRKNWRLETWDDEPT